MFTSKSCFFCIVLWLKYTIQDDVMINSNISIINIIITMDYKALLKRVHVVYLLIYFLSFL